MSDRIRVSPSGGVTVDIPEDILRKAIGEHNSRVEVAEIVTLAEIERRYIDHVLAHTSGNKTRAAQLLGINYHTLLRHLRARKAA